MYHIKKIGNDTYEVRDAVTNKVIAIVNADEVYGLELATGEVLV